MQRVRPALRYYLYGVYTVAALLASVLVILPTRASTDPLTILLFASLVALANSFPIFYNTKSLHTVDGIFLIASIPIISPLGLLFCILSGNIVFAVSGKQPWYRTVFNIAQNILSLGVVSLLFNVFHIWPDTRLSLASVLAFITIVGVYLVLHGVIIGIVFTLVQQQGLAQFLDNVRNVIPIYEVGVVVYGIVMGLLWHESRLYFFGSLVPVIILAQSFLVHARLEKINAQQRLAQEAIERMLTAPDLHSQLHTLLHHVMDIFQVVYSSVLMWGINDADDQAVELSPEGVSLPINEWRSVIKAVAEQKRITTLTTDEVMQVTQRRPLLIVPLVTSDELVGCLVLLTKSSVWMRRENLPAQQLLATFASQAASALYQARLIDHLQKSREVILQQAQFAAIGTVSAGVAHEFNNLLAMITNTAELAVADGDDHERVEALAMVAATAKQGGSITRGLLAFSRKLQPKREPADLYHAIDSVLAMLHAEFKRTRLQVIRDMQKIPPVTCDIGLLSQAILNLITNAIDAMRETGGTLTVGLAHHGNEVQIWVQDTGTGIPDQLRDQIFAPFVSTKKGQGEHYGGVGLGLSITHGVVTDHGGTIDVETVVGQGTTMTIRLPIEESVLQPLQDIPPVLSMADQRLQVVVVDDEPVLAKSLARTIKREGHQVQWFTNPLHALAAIQQHTTTIDLIVADMTMPEMDGVTLLHQVKALTPQTAQVLITGQLDANQVADVQAIGATIIYKPFSMEEITSVVKQVTLPAYTDA